MRRAAFCYFTLFSAAQLVSAACPEGMLRVDGDSGEIRSFCLDRTEVTVKDYNACVAAGECEAAFTSVAGPDIPERDIPFWSQSCNGKRKGRELHPINCVDWAQARRYCEVNDFRLPTEQEWQWAAAGGAEQRIYPWGERRPTKTRLNGCDFECLDRLRASGRRRGTLHYGEDGHADTAPVGSYPEGVGRWGHLDLAGNVWEYTSSRFRTGADVRVIRGGGWAQTSPQHVSTGYRGGLLETARGSSIGFRCAADGRPE